MAAASGWVIKPSDMALRSNNPIRKIVEGLKKPDLPGKPMIPLSLGDPSVFGNLNPPAVLVEAVEAALKSQKHNGYIHSAGTLEARQAIAKWSSVHGYPELTADDVVIGSGCSGALDLAISVLLNPGDNLLIPKPAFALYQTLCESKGIAVKHYNLIPARQWEADLEHMESLIDANTRAILVNNPSNPCGSVYSAAHLSAILALAEKHRLPIIADEIYGHLVFEGSAFVPMASLSASVPILSASGLAKEFLVPGWRVGWVTVHDRAGAFAEVRKGLFALSQLILGANSLVISAIPAVLAPEPGSAAEASLRDFHAATLAQLQENAQLTAARLRAIPGLEVVEPQGAMYVMFQVLPGALAGIASDVDFAKQLLEEENVFVLPGAAFNIPNFCRIVFCAPKDKLSEAFDRMAAFCQRRKLGGDAAAAGGAGAAAGSL